MTPDSKYGNIYFKFCHPSKRVTGIETSFIAIRIVTLFEHQGSAHLKRPKIDEEDLKILELLDRLGAKASAREISQHLDKAPRTVRYRLNRLKEKGYLIGMRLQAHERRLGLGENILFLEEKKGKAKELRALIEKIPCFYWYSPTFGRYNGYMVHSMYPLTTPNMNRDLAQEMERGGLVERFDVFDIVDYHLKRADLRYYDQEEGWQWDWNRWYHQLHEDISAQRENPLPMNLGPPLSDFDHIDVQILKTLTAEPEMTLRDLSGTVDLSESQVNKRVKRLEREGIIKEYRPIIDLFEDIMHVTLIIEMHNDAGSLIHALNRLPFRSGFAVDPPDRWSVKIELSAEDTLHLLEGLDGIRDLIDDYMFQIEIPVKKTEHENFCDRFNPDTKTWDLPVMEYVSIIREYAASH